MHISLRPSRSSIRTTCISNFYLTSCQGSISKHPLRIFLITDKHLLYMVFEFTVWLLWVLILCPWRSNEIVGRSNLSSSLDLKLSITCPLMILGSWGSKCRSTVKLIFLLGSAYLYFSFMSFTFLGMKQYFPPSLMCTGYSILVDHFLLWNLTTLLG